MNTFEEKDYAKPGYLQVKAGDFGVLFHRDDQELAKKIAATFPEKPTLVESSRRPANFWVVVPIRAKP